MASNEVPSAPPSVAIFAQVQSYIEQKKIPEAVKSLDSWLYGNKNVTPEDTVKVNQCVQNIILALQSQASEVEKQQAEAVKGLHPFKHAKKIQEANTKREGALAPIQQLVSSATKIKISADRLLHTKEVAPQLSEKTYVRSAKEALPVNIENLATALTQLLEQKEEEDNKPLEHFLQEQSQESLHHIIPLVLSRPLPDDRKVRLIKRLQEMYPQSTKYFQYNLGREEGFFRTIQPKGMEVAVHHLQEKGALTLPCEVSSDVEVLNDRLVQLAKQNDQTIHTFIAGDFTSEYKSPHWTPVMFYRSDDNKEYRIVITDSIDSKNPMSTSWKMLTRLENISQEITAQTGKPCKIMYFNEERQRDSNNCSIFSLHDVIRYSKNTALIKNYFENLLQVFHDSPQAKGLAVHTLPHYGFMRSAQSITQIEKNLATSVQYASEKRAAKLRERRAKLDLKDYMEVEVRNKESGDMEKKKQNVFIARQAQKYDGIIWKHILSEEQKPFQTANK